MKTTLGQKIRKIRQARDFTQDNMAYELGITKGAYSKIEREESNISIKRLEEIAKVLGVEVADFFKETKAGVEDSQKNYGFATKGDVEEIVKMIQELAKEVVNLKTVIKTKSPGKPEKKSTKK